MQWIFIQSATFILSILILASLLVTVLAKRGRTLQDNVFALLLTSLIFWMFFDFCTLQLSYHGLPHSLLGSFIGIAIHATSFFVYVLCEVFPENRPRLANKRRLFVVLLLSAAVSLVVFSSDWVSNRRFENGAPRADMGWLFIASGAYQVGLIALGLVRLSMKHYRLRRPLYKLQARYFIAGLGISTLMVAIFSILLPYFGMREYDIIGTSAPLLFIAIVIYGILVHRILDIQTATLRFALNMLTGLLVTALAHLLLVPWWPTQVQYSAPLLFVLLLFGLIFGRYAQPKLEQFFIPKVPRDADVILDLYYRREMTTSADTGFREQIRTVLDVLDRWFSPDRAFLLVVPELNDPWLHHTGRIPVLPVGGRRNPLLAFLPRLHLSPDNLDRMQIIDLTKAKGIGDQEEYAPWKKKCPRLLGEIDSILFSLRKQQYQLVIPLVARRRIVGYLVMGHGRNGVPFTSRHLRLLDSLRVSIALILYNQMYYEEIENLRSEAEAQVQGLTSIISKRETVRRELGENTLVYSSEIMRNVMDGVHDATSSQHPVLITGETGTGKELIARLIHDEREKRDDHHKYVALNCASIPASLWEDELCGHTRGAFTDAQLDRPGKLQEAGTGTLFFDEIGETTLELQAKLLRILQERNYSPLGSESPQPVHCRFIFATNRDLRKMVQEGEFREDLYFRINVFSVHLPPLRKRKEDIPLIAEQLLRKYSKEFNVRISGLDRKTEQALMRHNWPGNVRELENTLIRSVALLRRQPMSDESEAVLTDKMLLSIFQTNPGRQPQVAEHNSINDWISGISPGSENQNFDDLLAEFRDAVIRAALERSGGNRTKAAHALGIKRGRLLYQMNELDIE
ncbi:MAG: sigma 54-interacting transcriptional regulator [Leptospirales bacterium]|jgi:transcriptional regulator with GAF, ATPase, and Fis domain